MASGGMRARLSSASGLSKMKAALTSHRTPPNEMYFTRNHEWVQITKKDPSIARIGLSDYRAHTSGEYITIALDQIDLQEEVYSGQELCQVDTTTDLLESVKVPISGTVLKVNEILNQMSEIAHRCPESEGWLAEIQIANPADLNRLMTREEYENYLEKSGKAELLRWRS